MKNLVRIASGIVQNYVDGLILRNVCRQIGKMKVQMDFAQSFLVVCSRLQKKDLSLMMEGGEGVISQSFQEVH